MAACGFGTSGLKVPNLELTSVKPKLSHLQHMHGLRGQESVQFTGFLLSHRSKKALIECQVSNSEADSTANLEENSKEIISSDGLSTPIPNSVEIEPLGKAQPPTRSSRKSVGCSESYVESLLTALCDTSSIAEFELKLGGFQLHVTRELAEESTCMQPPSPPPVTAHSVVETPDSESSPSPALTKAIPSSGGVQTLLDKAADEGLTILHSPRVGYFRRSRTIKGKRAPPSCKEKDTVKEGQVVCYIEQLGGEIPVESDISGEVVKILKEDGDPVGYGDALLAVLPSFPGIMKLQ